MRQGPFLRDEEEWTFIVAPYLWALSLDGDITIRGTTQAVDVSFGDLLENLNFGANVRVEAWKGKWSFFADEMYAHLGDEISVGPIDIDAETTLSITELGALYRFWDTYLDDAETRMLSTEAMVGGRWVYIGQELDFSPGPNIDKSIDWVDPFVGGRVHMDLSDDWAMFLRGDVGGFGIGSASDFTWQVQASAVYHPWERTALVFGYGVLDIDYGRGSFGLDATMSGPHVALAYMF